MDTEDDGDAGNALKNTDHDRRSHANWANTSTRIPSKFAQLADLTSCCWAVGLLGIKIELGHAISRGKTP